MRLQLLSDLHLESEPFDPRPAPEAELLVLAGDIDRGWQAYERFRGWPVPVIVVAGNHEFDGREVRTAWPALRAYCEGLGFTLLERQAHIVTARDGRRVRFLGTVRWCDFDLFGPERRDKALRAGEYFQKVMRATCDGAVFDAGTVRQEALACRAWLADALAETPQGRWDDTVVVTHFAPSLHSADPRYGAQAGTASFCNADDDLLPGARLWLHGHVHCRQDYRVTHPDGRSTRVVSQARGLVRKGEADGFDPLKTIAL
jgi:hypothetical protein